MNTRLISYLALCLWLVGLAASPPAAAGPMEQRTLDAQLTAELGLTGVLDTGLPKLRGFRASPGLGQVAEPSLFGKLDFLRLRELHHIAERFGDAIWPGFDMRRIPIALNARDEQELLVGHPRPPAVFRRFDSPLPGDIPVWIRDGVTRLGPGQGGWAIQLGGRRTAYVSLLAEGLSTDRYFTLLTHECFHCYQDSFRDGADDANGELPTDDPQYSAKIGLESRILNSALVQNGGSRTDLLARMFVAVRHDRRKGLSQSLVRLEGEHEYSEGTASYAAARLLQLVGQADDYQPLPDNDDPQYHAFRDARERLDEVVADVLPPPDSLITFLHSMYNHGMAQCLLLDRVRPGWKREMAEKGSTQFGLLERQYPLSAAEEARLLAQARRRFDFEGQLAEQTRLVEAQVSRIRSFVFAEGRRYRIQFLPQSFLWKPKGPVHDIPGSVEEELVKAGIENELCSGRMIWEGGIRQFEQPGFSFAAGEVPNIFGSPFIEWIDRASASGDGGLKIEADERHGDTYLNATITTSGFAIKASKIRVQSTAKQVLLQALPVE